ncbi:MAG: lysozyme [Chromatiaceae bacterium]|nr:lysozyme [Chromatiaceae bacterium]
MTMSISPAGIAMIQAHEGLRLTAYRDAGGVWTIGYGSTAGVRRGMTLTRDQAVLRLYHDLDDAEATVNSRVTVPLTQGQFDALTSLVFNIGGGAFRKSTLLQKINAGDYAGAAAEFPRWVKAKGRILPGLVTRRAAERQRFEQRETP